ncbi:CDP-glycerol glycerophosphotransferase family protein [Turicibacter bilis]|uniref:CDP-glycerol glycerophosphotransferase family protein n=1 Tax=Turicibacter bilis TaxID=2735723 RepID=UPI001BB0AC46|nr:CDP-glycerol glycerophosphotransferase family protein [Turicibacter bilis]MBS3202809.1 CDP-glycerol glycerophosphotransferase family protein [Turicibacter bilis]UUF11142.1 CDP-glycerol glycerophosphotransferase family protein [Turicibacter bilis]
MSHFIVDIWKIFFSFIISKFPNKFKNCWIVAERGVDARDNGYWFYKYMRINYQNKNVFYIISQDSPDFEKVNKLGNIIRYNSIQHGIAYFSAQKLISTHPYFCRPEWKGIGSFENRGVLKVKGKRIFLQHGITKDYIPGLTQNQLNADLFICGAKPEYEYIKECYGYSEEKVKYTGFARFDNLFESRSVGINNMILLMPTWRHYMRRFESIEDFQKSEYFQRYNEFINNKDFIQMLDKYNYYLVFYPHFEVQKWVNCFSSISDKIIIAKMGDFDVQKLLIDCDILITDYSSVFFDVAYLKKMIIFYQFDYEEYRDKHYEEGYFDYRNSFGPVVESGKALLDVIEYSIINGNAEKYLKNISSFFEYDDNDNCRRIYEAIELEYES